MTDRSWTRSGARRGRRRPSVAAVVAAVTLALALAAPGGAETRLAARAAPPDTGDGWRVSTPEEQGLSTDALEELARRVRTDPVFAHAYALLVVRHGTLVFEEHFNGRDSEQRADVRSVTKSVLSLAVGIARQEGRLPRSLATPLRDLLPGYADLLVGGKERITLFDALSMQAGLRWDDAANPWLDELFRSPDVVAYALGEPLVAEPGTVFEYSTGLSQVIAKVLIEATGSPLSEYVHQRLFEPLGFRNTGWLRRPDRRPGVPGDHFGGLGLQVRPRDMAKLGQLVLQRGRWRGVAVVPADWIRESTVKQAGDANYGYHWWAPDDADWAVAIGYGGQYVFVDRVHDQVLVLQVDFDGPPERHVLWSEFTPLIEGLRDGLRAESVGTIGLGEATVTEVGEGDGAARIELVRAGGDGSVEVAFRTRPRSARSGSDFVPREGSLVWGPGETGSREVAVELIDDRRVEPDEELDLELEISTGGDRLEVSRVRILVTDDDGAATVALGVTSAVVAEGGELRLPVRRDRAEGELRVAWEARALVAEGDGDLASTSGVVVFPAGALEADLRVGVVDDGEPEPLELFEVRLTPSSPAALADQGAGVAAVAVLDAAGAGGCGAEGPVGGDSVLCLHDGRFRVSAAWRVEGTEPSTGHGGASALSAESGWFWFFDPGSLELLVKVLDGGAINGSYWVSLGALSDVELFVVVEDLAAGEARLYRRPAGSLCGVADTSAFPSASAAGGVASGADSRRPREALASAGGAPLLDRFEIEVEWTDPATGAAATAGAIDLTRETELQWFFSPGNVEMATKVLDGRAINGHYWLFASALTDVGYRLVVTDRDSGEVRVYESGEPLCGVADVEAFSAR